MPKHTADIVGTTGSSFTIKLSSAVVSGAKLAFGQRDVDLEIGGGNREVVVNSLPAGDSVLYLDLIWSPNDNDASIDLGGVINGSANVVTPRRTIPAGETPACLYLFGTDSTGPR